MPDPAGGAGCCNPAAEDEDEDLAEVLALVREEGFFDELCELFMELVVVERAWEEREDDDEDGGSWSACFDATCSFNRPLF